MAIKQFFALVVLGATATSFSMGVDAHRRSVKKINNGLSFFVSSKENA